MAIPSNALAIANTSSKARDIALPPNAVIAAIIRQGEIVIPRGQVRFEAEDEVLAIVDTEAAEELARLLGHPVAAPLLRKR